jgi:hypothetical protein
MKTLQSNTARIGTVALALAAFVAVDISAAFAQSHSSSRYSYRYSTPAEQHSWYDRGNTDFNS